MNIQKINFILDKNISSIQCSKKDKICSICQEYANKLSKDINTLSFLYEGNKINFELTFENYSNNKNEITILVNEKDTENINNILINLNKIDNIKSKYIIKIIFSYMSEKIKLKTIKYSKYLQNKLNIELINYKLFSGRYIKEENGIVLEYDYNDNLIFEGEYLNGQRNGKGKEYSPSNKELTFEGEYLNGMKNGKGKEYYYKDKIKFEGEYLSNKRWNGIMYDLKNKDITYKIENGKGFIKEDNFRNYYLTYEGDYLNGKGKLFFFEDMIFEGEFKNGKKWNGIGYGRNNQIIYEIKEGKGTLKKPCYKTELNEKIKIYDDVFDDKFKLECEYNFGELNGKVKVYNSIGILKLEGEFLNGELNGPVKEYYNDNQLRFDGEYLYNYKLRGKEFINGRLDFEGDYLFNKKWKGKGYDENGDIIYELKNGTGKVKLYDNNGNIEFDGEFINGIINGKGKKYSKGKLIYDGEFLNGKKNGKGIEYDSYGQIIFEGDYLNDKIWNGKGKDDENKIIFKGEYKNGQRWNGYAMPTGCNIARSRFLYIYKDGKKTTEYYKNQ